MGPKVSVSTVAKHKTYDDCWMVVNGKVYDLTTFAPEHPGGPEMVYRWAGLDASKTYNTYHAADLIEKELPESSKKGDLDESTVTEEWQQASKADIVSQSNTSEEPPPLAAIINLDDFEQAFAKFGPVKANAYVSGASNDLLTYNANKQAWHKLWFRPRILRNVSQINTQTTLFGCDLTMPVWICPMGIAKTAGPEGEAALGKGAARAGIVHCMSTATSLSVEDILASAPNAPWFFQLYVDRQRDKTEKLLQRLNGMPQIKALFVTVDLAVVSKREADERIKTQEITSVYAGQQKSSSDSRGGGLARSTGSFIDPALSWDDVAWIRKYSKHPIVLKGIQSAADAKKAMDLGCAGIVVSNHGGRSLDNAPATVAILLELRRDCPQVFRRMDVHVDGGIRRGSDILKAVCIGAKGVGIGRPFQCSVAYGSEGVEHCATIIRDELETAMRLCGVTDLNKVRGDMRYLNTSELDPLLAPPKERYPPLPSGWFWSRL